MKEDDEIAALLETAEPITITVDKKNILHYLRILPRKKTILLKPLPYGVLVQISSCFEGVEEMKGESIITMCRDIVHNNKRITKAVCYAINRSPEREPSNRLLKFVMKNIQTEDLTHIIFFILTQMQMGNFTSAIGLLTRRMIADSDQDQK